MKKIILIILCTVPLCMVPAASAGAVEIEGVPFYKQERLKCGPAALASVLAFYGMTANMPRIIEATYSPTLKGSLISDLENYAGTRGLQTQSGQGRLAFIKESIQAQKPVIALLDLGVWRAKKPHYIVIFGFNEVGFIAHDGSTPAKIFKYAGFEKSWAKMGRPFLVVHP